MNINVISITLLTEARTGRESHFRCPLTHFTVSTVSISWLPVSCPTNDPGSLG